MTAKELQEEELEVLRSIYEGDPNFKEVNATTFQYKIGEDGSCKSFLLEISWGENYPDEIPCVHLDAFYNKHITKDVKETIISRLQKEVEQFLGTAVTFTLLDWAKENADDLLKAQPETSIIVDDLNVNLDNLDLEDDSCSTDNSNLKKKKVQLTKAQKRKMYDRVNAAGEHPRGYDWVDIVKHLGQTGGKEPSPPQQSDS